MNGSGKRGRLVETVTLAGLAEIVDGHIVGDPATVCHNAQPLQDVTAGSITLLDDPKRLHELHQTQAVAVVVEQPLDACPQAQLVVDDLHAAFGKIVERFRGPQRPLPIGISPQAVVDATATIGQDTAIAAGAQVAAGVVLGDRCRVMPGVIIMQDCVIGNDCTLFPGVVLYEQTVLEDRVTIHAGSVLGAYGFGYRQENGQHVRHAQLGNVYVESDVEIGASVTVDRGTYGSTRIGMGTKIDNQVMIAHNCQIGRHNLLCSQVGIAGSCRTGDHVVLAGQVGLKDHVTLGDQAIVAAQAGVMDDLPGKEVYLGSPATTQRNQMQIFAVQRRLPEMRKAIQRLTKELEAIRAGLSGSAAGLPESEPSTDRDNSRAA